MNNWTFGSITLNPYEISALAVLGVMAAMYFTAKLTGWQDLARSYRSQQPFRGKKWHCQSARMRSGSNYDNCLTVGVDEQGLYLSPFFPFSIGHAPLFIPWGDLTARRKKVFFVYMVELQTSRTPNAPIEIMESLAKQINEAFPNRIPIT